MDSSKGCGYKALVCQHHSGLTSTSVYCVYIFREFVMGATAGQEFFHASRKKSGDDSIVSTFGSNKTAVTDMERHRQ